ncbi:hypothetical protein [Nonomuraea sp. NPDC023979]|uniref:hypothetical protein n=1 Tax=Nonomuraea sp. NPDC023979 TaxID=3154796 RepID=UPI0033F7B8A5
MTTTITIPAGAAQLPRWRGLLVPYVTEWTSHGQPMWPTITTPEYGPTKSCTCRPGHGEPLFTEICGARLREAVTRQLCQTCGHHVPGDDMVFLGGHGSTVYANAAMHADCCRYALQVCSGLLKAMPEDRWYVAAAVGYTILLQVKDVERFVPADERHLHDGPVTHWYPRPVITSYTRAADWLAEQASR